MVEFVLFWNRADNQGNIEMGTFATRGEAWAAIPSAFEELIGQCGDEECVLEINAGSWSIVERERSVNMGVDVEGGCAFCEYDVGACEDGGACQRIG